MTDHIAANVPAHLHVVDFRAEGVWGVRAFCKGCGWQLATKSPSQSQDIYWRARQHLAEQRASE